MRLLRRYSRRFPPWHAAEPGPRARDLRLSPLDGTPRFASTRSLTSAGVTPSPRTIIKEGTGSRPGPGGAPRPPPSSAGRPRTANPASGRLVQLGMAMRDDLLHVASMSRGFPRGPVMITNRTAVGSRAPDCGPSRMAWCAQGIRVRLVRAESLVRNLDWFHSRHQRFST